MLADELKTYDSWDLEKPSIPLRSRLCQLEPVGIGTPLVESLTGYVARLAEAHCVLPGILILREIAPLVKEGYVFQGAEGGLNQVFSNNTAKALNGMGSMADAFVQALETLTFRHNLRFLTMLTWGEVIPPRDLPRTVRAWCPTCYEEWRVNQQIIYEPLLWSFKAVKICLRHHQPLCEQCPHCHKKSAPLAWRSQPGFCPKCSGWLGVAAEDKQKTEDDEFKWQLWVVNNIGELLSVAPSLSFPPPKQKIKRIISAYVDKVTEGSLSAFANLLGLCKSTVWAWHAGKGVPSLDTLLQLCQQLDISLTDFLIREVVVDLKVKLSRPQLASYRHLFDKDRALHELKGALGETPPPSMTEVRHRLGYKTYVTLYEYFPELCSAISKRHRDYKSSYRKEKLRCELEDVLRNNEYPPPSLIAVAKRLGYSPMTFYNNFPELSYAISERYTSYLSASHAELIARLVEEARTCAISLHNQQIEPTVRRVAEKLTKPGAIRNKEVRAALHEVRLEMGWEVTKLKQ